MCGRAVQQPWSAWLDADTPVLAVVGPWQYQSGGWVGGTRYSTHPVPPLPHHPGYSPTMARRCCTRTPAWYGVLGACTYDRFEAV